MSKRKGVAPAATTGAGRSRSGAPARRFKELEVVRLSGHFDGPDGRIPSGTQGKVLQVFGHGEAYQVEFGGEHDVPETVPAALLVSDARSAMLINAGCRMRRFEISC